MLAIGTKAPQFTLPDQNGDLHSLAAYKGKKVILYFYPKDHTAGCTKEACGFRDYNYFITIFGRLAGTSPRQYRLEHLKGE